jgi:hypothetical protein
MNVQRRLEKMPRFIIDTDKMAEEMKGIAPEARGEFVLCCLRNAHTGVGLSEFLRPEKVSASIARSPYTPQFEEFWKAYPKQRRIGKGAAAKAWQKIKMDKDELLRLCLDAIKWQKLTEQWRRDNCQFVPHPTTYINQRRWEDEMPDDIDPNHTPTVKTDMNGREITT